VTSPHPTLPELHSLLRDPGTEEGVREGSGALRHLLRGCASCRAYLRSKMVPGDRLPEEPDLRSIEPDREYDAAFAASEEMVALFTSPSSLDSLNELLTHQGAARPFPRSHRSVPRLIKWLVASSHAIRFDDPEKMLNLANMARLAAEACTPAATASRHKLADLRAGAWSQFGNALRVRGFLREAEQAFVTAHREHGMGTGDPEIRARMLQHIVSLHIYDGRLQDGARAAEEACSIFRRLGNYHQLATSLIQKGIVRIYQGNPEESFLLCKQALPLIDFDEEPEILLAARHNLLRSYIDLGNTAEAVALAHETDEMFAGLRNPLLLLRLRWQEGEMLRDLGHLQGAAQKMSEARQGFLQWGMPYEFAVISLDLSNVYSQQGAAHEVEQIARETVPLCQALQLKKATMALLLQAGEASGRFH
jgi:tetratricopeptide (TPR) repeat protein